MDIATDTAIKVAHMLAPEHSVDAIFGFLSLLQSLISFITFGHPLSLGALFGAIMQTYGYFLISTSCAVSEFEVSRGVHPVFGSKHETAGLFFAIVALILNSLSITMIEALSGNVKLTVGELCRGNGFMGFAITAAYHALVLATKTEKYVVLVPVPAVSLFTLAFVVAAAVQQYSQCWLVLHTRAVEYARTAMFASVVLFGIRRSVFREDGAAYGFYKVPLVGGFLTVAGLALISFTPPIAGGRRVDAAMQAIEP
jgi:hypothetical protein